jgi:hypothetical protein
MSTTSSTPMPRYGSFHLIEAVIERLDGAPVGERRCWSDEFKVQAIAAAMAPEVNVSALARRLGISPPTAVWLAQSISEDAGFSDIRYSFSAGSDGDCDWGCDYSCEPGYRGSRSVSDHSCGVRSMIPSGVKAFLASHPVYFRKGPDGGFNRSAQHPNFLAKAFVFLLDILMWARHQVIMLTFLNPLVQR